MCWSVCTRAQTLDSRKQATLHVRVDNDPAIRLYVSKGYVVQKVHRNYYEDEGIDAYIMKADTIVGTANDPPQLGKSSLAAAAKLSATSGDTTDRSVPGKCVRTTAAYNTRSSAGTVGENDVGTSTPAAPAGTNCQYRS